MFKKMHLWLIAGGIAGLIIWLLDLLAGIPHGYMAITDNLRYLLHVRSTSFIAILFMLPIFMIIATSLIFGLIGIIANIFIKNFKK